MRNKKETLRKTAAFITSLVFVFSSLSYGYIYAEEVTETAYTEITESETQEVTETSEPEQTTEVIEEEPENNQKKTVKIFFTVNGTSDVKPLGIFHRLFKQIFVTGISDGEITAEIAADMIPEKCLWEQNAYDAGEKIFIDADDIRYRLDSVKTKDDVTEVCITECYDISGISMQEISIVPAEEELYDGKYAAYNSWMRIQPSKGWVIDGTSMFKLKGEVLPYISNTGEEYRLIVQNGNEHMNFPLRKSEYTVSYPLNRDMGVKINSYEGFEYKGFWIDSQIITGEFELNENSMYKIVEAELRNTGTDKKYPMEIKGDGKNVTASLNTDSLEEKFTDGEEYCFDLKIVSDNVRVETYISDGETEELYGKLEYETSVKDNECFIKVPPVIFENGVAKYIIDSYENNLGKQWIDAKKILEEGKIYDMIQLLFDSSSKVYYKKIIIDQTQNYEIDKATVFSYNENVFLTKKLYTQTFLKYNTSFTCMALFDELSNNLVLKKNSNFDSDSFQYTYKGVHDITALNLKSILYYENNEFHNMLQEPMYFYFDDYAPKIKLTNTKNDGLDNSQWSRLVYNFTLDVNDAESFPQVEGAGEELNTVYSRLDGVSSEITKITVGDTVFEKQEGEWITVSEENSPYIVALREESENKFTFSVAVSVNSDLKGIDKSIAVTASDRCGNTSEPESFELKIDTTDPVVSSMKIRNAVHYNDPAGGKTAAVGNSSDIVNDRFYLDVEAFDDYSGIDTVQVEYGSFSEQYTVEELKNNELFGYRSEGGRASFSLPLNAESNWRSLIKIILRDKAGNNNFFYYSDDENPAVSAESATFALVDRINPEVSVSVASEPVYKGNDGSPWYSRIPEFRISADDKFGKVNSGIRYLHFDVNGSSGKAEDIFQQKTDNFTITAEHSEKDPDIAEIFYTDGTNKVKIAETDLKKSNGKLQIEVCAEDAAGNKSETASLTVFVDANPPEADKYFSIENENDNYRAFGTFLNHGTKVRVNVSEPEGKPSAGLMKAELYYNGTKTECDFSSEKSAVAEFEIPFSPETGLSSAGTLKMILTDNAGNTYTSDYLLSPKDNSLLMFESVPPEINDCITDSIVKYIDAENNVWYSDDVNLHFSTEDVIQSGVYSGIKSFQADINGKNIISEDYRDSDRMISSSDYIFSTVDAEENDGKYDIRLRAEDNAGNSTEYLKTVFVDRTAPEITGISIEGIGSVPLSILNGVYALPYGYFFRDECAVTVYAKDENASSGLNRITVSLCSMDGTPVQENVIKDFRYENDEYSSSFTVPEGFRGYIVIEAADNTGNISEKYTPSGFITENSSRHDGTSSVSVKLPETQYTDRNGLPLYSGDTAAEIILKDSFSGINKVEWNQNEYGENVWKQIIVSSDGKITGDNAENFTVSETEKNLVLSLNGKLNSASNKNASEIKIRMTDNSGNISEDTKVFSIDRDAPAVSVSWDEAVSDSKSGIYSTARTAHISVRERNFDSGRMNVSVEGDEGGVSYGQWKLVSGTEGTDSAVYRMTVTFSGNGEYTLGVNGSDLCDNKAQGYSSEKFIIDRTAPVLEVLSSGAEKVNGQYFSGSRTVTVKITEHNFDASRIKISGTVNGSEENFPKISGFNSNGDVHTAVLTFSENAQYTISIEGEDAAGNTFDGYSESFIVDSTAPEIIFDGVKNRSANNGEVNLSVFIRDENITSDRISIKVTGAKRGDITESAGILERTSGGYVFRFSEFTKEKETDDIYTVTVKAEDKAENQTSETLVFSVNRFGSTYVFDENTLILANTYINKPVDIILHEINADTLLMDKTRIQVIRDAEITELTRDKDYTVECTGGEENWYDYKYTIKSENFADDAAYQVVILSED
ncbi:MAG: Ig-like domain-containing protein, partial [Oscillospiraceae bacterium]